MCIRRDSAAIAAWTIEGDNEGPTHEELAKRLGKVAIVAIFQDCGRVSTKRREGYGNRGPTRDSARLDTMHALHVLQRTPV
jgi:hypothetical protein